ncbi:hypothetical protein A1O7_05211 [Cladophialophora yegresii CBS 114405]|uniref:Uncharacterized protein n=1 Tax=Cladophialophora yegresii CBS 114405 TaxID=1182544 RepID=W9VZG2_9EURO|nr:uncharacterized protein A1O7_05211 [Cladophialophora yegresii CBS 114405]EXJ61058.1 hypothetical protein A1O7_05211 [Cladophialophora yegresii CBS 114405]
MDQKHLEVLASKKSQELQLLQSTLGKSVRFNDMEASIMRHLTRDANWRWLPSRGLQVAIPQDSGQLWISREPVHDLENRIRPSILGPNAEPDPNAGRALEEQEYVWLLAQILHYGLCFAATPLDATAIIARALLKCNLQQPCRLAQLARRLRGEYECRGNTQQQSSIFRQQNASRKEQGTTGQVQLGAAPSISPRRTVDKVLSEKARGKLRTTSSLVPDCHLESTKANDTQPENYGEGVDDGGQSVTDSDAGAQPTERLCTVRQRLPSSSPRSGRTRQMSPPIQVLGEGVFGGFTNWLSRPLSLSRWITHVCSPRATNRTCNSGSKGEELVAGVKGHPIVIDEQGAGNAADGRLRPLTGHGAKITTEVSDQRTIAATGKPADIPFVSKSICPVPLSKPAIVINNRCERRSSFAPSRVDDAFPSAKPAVGRQWGKAKAPVVAPNSASGGGTVSEAQQTKGHGQTNQDKVDSNTRLLQDSVPPTESGTSVVDRSALGCTISTSNSEKRPSTGILRRTTDHDNQQSVNRKDMVSRSAKTHDAVRSDQPDRDDARKKRSKNQRSRSRTKHRHGQTPDATMNPPQSKAKLSGNRPSFVVAATHLKSSQQPSTGTKPTTSPSLRQKQPALAPDIMIGDLISLPPSSISQMSLTPASNRGHTSRGPRSKPPL